MNTYFNPKGVDIVKFFFTMASLVFILSGCATVSADKIDSWVSMKYKEVFPLESAPPKNFLIVKLADTAQTFEKASFTKQKEGSTQNLVFYNKWHFYHVCTINKEIPANSLRNTILFYSTKKHLREKLNGMSLELTIVSVPHVFSHLDNGYKSFFGIMGGEDLYIKPDKKPMIVNYRVFSGATETKKGTITIPNVDQVVDKKLTTSAQVATTKYLEQYDLAITTMSKAFLDKLLAEL